MIGVKITLRNSLLVLQSVIQMGVLKDGMLDYKLDCEMVLSMGILWAAMMATARGSKRKKGIPEYSCYSATKNQSV